MKQLFLGVAAVAAMMFVACSDDSGTSANDDDVILSSSSEESSAVSSSSTKKSSSSSSSAKSSSSTSKYVCDIYDLADALSCDCDESREDSLAYNYDSNVELVCIYDEYLNKWGWVKKAESSSSCVLSSSEKESSQSSSSVILSDDSREGSSAASSSSSSVPSEYSNFDFVWNALEEWLAVPCADSLDGKLGIALYRSDKGEFLCKYDSDEKEWAWTKVGGISSSSVSSSSSVVASSSSSEYVPYDHSLPLYGIFEVNGRYKQFTDKRNGRSYYYLTITSNTYKDSSDKALSVTVMAENLNIGKIVNGADEQNDDTQIERYCYDDDTTYCDKYGGLYQWAEMMALPSKCNTVSCADSIKPNHQGICPEGWRLFTEDDYHIVATSEDNTKGIEGLRATQFNGYNQSGFSLLGAGYRSPEGTFANLRGVAYWFYPVEYPEESYVDAYARDAYINGQTETPPKVEGGDRKVKGFSVRCSKIE